jgi:hypothetical protein
VGAQLVAALAVKAKALACRRLVLLVVTDDFDQTLEAAEVLRARVAQIDKHIIVHAERSACVVYHARATNDDPPPGEIDDLSEDGESLVDVIAELARRQHLDLDQLDDEDDDRLARWDDDHRRVTIANPDSATGAWQAFQALCLREAREPHLRFDQQFQQQVAEARAAFDATFTAISAERAAAHV